MDRKKIEWSVFANTYSSESKAPCIVEIYIIKMNMQKTYYNDSSMSSTIMASTVLQNY